jgi:hypothetical protein
MKIKVEVTERDIRLGREQILSNSLCPVARAISRAVGKSVDVGVSWASINRDYDVVLPKKCQAFIDRLCRGKSLKPFSFTISLPAKTR